MIARLKITQELIADTFLSLLFSLTMHSTYNLENGTDGLLENEVLCLEKVPHITTCKIPIYVEVQYWNVYMWMYSSRIYKP